MSTPVQDTMRRQAALRTTLVGHFTFLVIISAFVHYIAGHVTT